MKRKGLCLIMVLCMLAGCAQAGKEKLTEKRRAAPAKQSLCCRFLFISTSFNEFVVIKSRDLFHYIYKVVKSQEKQKNILTNE